jgi:NADPH2 dehydrogenase
MSQPILFQPLSLRGLTLSNRVGVAPMCQYSARDGQAQDWHVQHYGALAASGPGMVTIEATGVVPEGRISAYCLGLYDEASEAAMTRLVASLKHVGTSAVAIQLAHAGRKAAAMRSWEGGGPAPDGWPTLSASDLAFGPGWPAPKAATADDLDRVTEGFVQAAQRALRAGIDAIELHSAHGYLLHQFLSPLTNRRTDRYGGSLDNRMRFPLEVVAALRKAWPTDKPLGIRISATDWAEGGWDIDEAVIYAQAFRDAGIDYVCVSTGGLVPDAKVPVGPGYQRPFARRIRAETGLVTRAVGLIATGHDAEATLQDGDADLIAIGRGFLDDPRWTWRAAEALGVELATPPQYIAARPRFWPGAALTRPKG